jgi:iron(III) transport system permease protein
MTARTGSFEKVLYRGKSLFSSSVLWVLLSVLVIMPVGILFYAAFLISPPRPGSAYTDFTFSNLALLTTPGLVNATRNSLIVATGSTIGIMLVGTFLAWLVARTDVPYPRAIQVFGIAPLFLSSMVGAIAWTLLASPRTGYLTVLFGEIGVPIPLNIYSLGGMIFVFIIYYSPYVFLFVFGALTLMNPEYEEAAVVSGATRFRTARSVTLPLVTPAIVGSSLLCFVLIIENFPVPQVLGTPARIDTLPSTAYRLMNFTPSRATEAAAIGVLLIILMGILLFAQNRLVARRDFATARGKGLRTARVRLGLLRWPAFVFVVLYAFVAVVLPFFALSQMAMRRNRYVSSVQEIFLTFDYTIQPLIDLFDYQPFTLGMRNSLLTGLGTSIAGTLLYLVMVYRHQRTASGRRHLLEIVAMMPLATPALILGLGFLWTWYLLPLPLYGTLWILILAYVVRFMPQGFRNLSASIAQIHPELEESAWVCGATKSRTAAAVTFPLMRTSIVSTMLILFVLAIRELSAAIFLFTSQTRVVAIVIYDLWEAGNIQGSAGVSILYSIVLLFVAILARRSFGSAAA